MNMTLVDDYANRLFAAHGDRAEYEAAQKAKSCEEAGQSDEAEQWRKVREKIRILRGPNVS
ncbi:MAG: hypothetical protein KDK03_02035 [Rhodobacteraceae bacterium]|uniref:hypothetical protein n=1 Tax=Amaricoccus sp. B4 TaxID=3368557 RepID=UPI000DACD548|nr:hypothetical protein [Paracoccaceae bacterium]